MAVGLQVYRVGQNTGPHQTMTIILSNLHRLKNSLEDSLVNLQLNGY